jgi:hypothetical protein
MKTFRAHVADGRSRTWCGAWFHERLLMRRLGAVVQINYRRTDAWAYDRLRPDSTDPG